MPLPAPESAAPATGIGIRRPPKLVSASPVNAPSDDDRLATNSPPGTDVPGSPGTTRDTTGARSSGSKTGRVGRRRARSFSGDERAKQIANACGTYKEFLAAERVEQQELENERARLAQRDPVAVTDLPVFEARTDIIRRLQQHRVCLLIGETGSGKTLLAPYMALEAGLGQTGMIVQTEPRRVAARQIARRLAQMSSTRVGELFGLQTRTDKALSRQTVCKIATDGILLNELRDDPLLSRYSLIILDEAHERSINIDLLLGLILRIMKQRDDLKLLVSSATIDEGKFARFLELSDDQIINVPGRMFPVEVRYTDWEPERSDELFEELPRQCALAVKQICEEGPGDILVFVPRAREIASTLKELRRVGCPMSQLLPLPMHGSLSADDNDRAFSPTHLRKVIVATNIAETSITVPGIRYVVDTGFVNLARFNPKTGIGSLHPERISAASARQRMGRAGRVQDGVCIRLHSQELYDNAKQYTDPEILRSDLDHLVLYMRSNGITKLREFPFIDRPDPLQLKNAERKLVELGALENTKEKAVTPLGMRMAALPLEPSLGRMLLEAEALGCVQEMLSLTACLAAGREPFVMPPPSADGPTLEGARKRINEAKRAFADQNSDFVARLNIWREYSRRPWREREHFCQRNSLSIRVLEEIAAIRRDLVEAIGEQLKTSSRSDYDAINRCVLAGHVQNVCVKGGKYDYTAIGRQTVYLHPGSVMFDTSQRPDVIVARQLEKGESKTFAVDVAAIAPGWVEALAAHMCSYVYEGRRYDGKAGKVLAEETIYYQDLTLSEARTVDLCRRNNEEGVEVLVREGLLREKLGVDIGFLRHNADVLDEVKRVAVRLGDRSLIPEEHTIVRFYAERLAGVKDKADAAARIGRSKRLLDMRVEDFIPVEQVRDANRWFPVEARLGGATREVDFVDDPFNLITRTSMSVPVHVVPRLTEAEVERAVPGLARRRHNLLVALLNAAIQPAEAFVGSGVGMPPIERACVKVAGAAEGEYAPIGDEESAAWLQEFLTADPFDSTNEGTTTLRHVQRLFRKTRGQDIPAPVEKLYDETMRREQWRLVVEVLDEAGKRVAMSAEFAEIGRSVESERIRAAWRDARAVHETDATDRYQDVPALFDGLLQSVHVMRDLAGHDIHGWIGLAADPTANSFARRLFDDEDAAVRSTQKAVGHYGRMQLMLDVTLNGQIDRYTADGDLEQRYFHMSGSSASLNAKLRRLLARSVTEPELTRDDILGGRKALIAKVELQRRRAPLILDEVDGVVDGLMDAMELAGNAVYQAGGDDARPDLADETAAAQFMLKKLDDAHVADVLRMTGRLHAVAGLAAAGAMLVPEALESHLRTAGEAVHDAVLAPVVAKATDGDGASSERKSAVGKDWKKKKRKKGKDAQPVWVEGASEGEGEEQVQTSADPRAAARGLEAAAGKKKQDVVERRAVVDDEDDDETGARIEHNRRGFQRLIDRCTEDGDLRAAGRELLDRLMDAGELDLRMDIEWDEDRANDAELSCLIEFDDMVEGWLARLGMALADVLADLEASGMTRPSRKDMARTLAGRAFSAIVS
ncbi:MAG: DUF3418 domain-containing protein [Planctomycetota bacterium]